MIVSYWTGFNKYYVSWPYFLDLILSKIRRSALKTFWMSPIGSCEINRSSKEHIWWTWFHMTFFKVSYWTVPNKYFIPATCLMNPISFIFFSTVRFKYLRAKYWTSWTAFNKYFILKPYMMNLISCDFFRRSVLNI